MRDALKAYLSLAAGITEVTRQRAVATAKALVSQGEATAEQVSSLAEDLVAQTRANREAVSALAKFEVDRALGAPTLMLARERKGNVVTDDLRPQILALEVVGPTPTGARLHAELGTQPRTLRPAELLAALERNALTPMDPDFYPAARAALSTASNVATGP